MSQLVTQPSVIRTDVMPSPAPKSSKPKLKLAPEDDELLIDLKENHLMSQDTAIDRQDNKS